jgi:hypothetical protein
MMHAESLGSTRLKVGQNVNVYASMAKLKAFEIHLRPPHNHTDTIDPMATI